MNPRAKLFPMLHTRIHHLVLPGLFSLATASAWAQTEAGKTAPSSKPTPVLADAVLPLPKKIAATEAAAALPGPGTKDLPPNELFDPNGLPIPTAAPTPPPVEEDDEEPSMAESLAVNLVKRMVERGMMSKEDAQDLFRVAEADVNAAKEKRQKRKAAAQELALATGTPVPGVTASSGEPGASGGGTVAIGEKIRVTYVPEFVKKELRDQIKDELKLEVKNGGMLSPTLLPEWVSAWKPFVDFRMRYEYDSFPSGNDVSGAFPNFNVINTGQPYDTSSKQFAPQLNANQDRERIRLRLRLRLGTEIDLGDHFILGVRVGTGDSNSPVSGNQTLGSTNTAPGGNFSQQGGQFSKYSIWLDRAFLKWEPVDSIALTIGRFDNPFFSTNAIWSDDIGFDGVVLKSRYALHDGLEPFLTLGSFPIFNTDYNVASNQPAKFASHDKWLHAGQVGVDWKVSKDWHAKVASAYYYFQNIQGQLSSPYAPQSADDAGDTDSTRPTFAQKGNTYRPLRNIIANATNGFGTTNQFQYYGLASSFHVGTLTARIDYNGFEPFQVSLLAEYLQNLAFNKSAINAVAVNNLNSGGFAGGNKAWDVNLRFGTPTMQKRGDWMSYIGYTHRESDSVVDGFNDQNFGGGGTNLQGYTIGGAIALSPRVNTAMRWMSASQIAGPQFKSDIVMFDINAKF
jgi:hypothetical protein